MQSVWPAREFYAVCDAFWEFSNNYHLSYLVYSPVLKCDRPACEPVPFKRIWKWLEWYGLIMHFCDSNHEITRSSKRKYNSIKGH